MADDGKMSDQELHLRLTAGIVEAFVAGNRLPADEVSQLISEVHRAFARLGERGDADPAALPRTPTRAEVKRSITPEGLVSFEDGKVYQTLKRHLSTRGLTPQTYREKWGLPVDYPMVASEYAARRSQLAKASGLGNNARAARRSKRSMPGR